MTLVEFVAPLKAGGWRDKCLAVLFFLQHYEEREAATVENVRRGIQTARLPGWRRVNVADVLAKSGELVDSPSVIGTRRAWSLTRTGEAHVRAVLGVPTIEPELQHDVGALTSAAHRIMDLDARAFVEEGIECLRFGALRASVVFLWAGAIRVLQARAVDANLKDLNAALKTHDPKARNVSKVDDFAYIRDKTALLAFSTMGLIDKGQRSTLEEALDLRNRCGHPTKYRPGHKKVSSFVEDVAGIVFG